MNENSRQGFFGIIITKEVLDDKELNITEKVVYGYVASFRRCCFESNEAIADKLGVSESTVSHTLPKLVSKGYLFIEKTSNNNRRIYSVLDDPKKLAYLAKKGAFKLAENNENKPVEKPVENYENVRQNMPNVRQNLPDVRQNMPNEITGVRSAKFADIDIEENKNKAKTEQNPNTYNTPAGTAGKRPASRRYPKRSDYESDMDYERAFYARNTVHLGATN
jgi:DNA-binding MarR family transcriptional regulator